MEEKPLSVYFEVEGRKFDVSTFTGFRDASTEINKVYRQKVEEATYRKNTAIDKVSGVNRYEKEMREAAEWRKQRNNELMKVSTFC